MELSDSECLDLDIRKSLVIIFTIENEWDKVLASFVDHDLFFRIVELYMTTPASQLLRTNMSRLYSKFLKSDLATNQCGRESNKNAVPVNC